jgi:hypothetical protein
MPRDFNCRIIRFMTVLLVLAAAGGCNAKRHKILCGTDHQAVLAACREILANASAWGLKLGGRYSVRWTPHSPESAKFPKAILDLAPSYVAILEDGCITVEMHGGPDHFGFRAYSKNFKEPEPHYWYGDRELIDGLWYYDGEYTDESPNHKKKIDAWIEECKRKNGGK